MTKETTKRAVRRKPRSVRAGVAAMLTVYSVCHLCVDMCCCAAMLAFTRDTEHFALSLLIYNFCAFALQLPIGAIADRFSRSGAFAVFGCAVVALSMLATPAPVVLAALLGIGNACFHVGGGVFALRSDRRSTSLGIFVSPGAIGLFAGRYAVDTGLVSEFALMVSVAVIMILCVLAILLTEPVSDTYESVAPFPKGLSVSYPMRNFMACVCFFIVVCMRSFGGMTFNFGWRADTDAAVAACALAVAAALGKASGGIMADKLGMRAASSVTLIVSAALMIFSQSFIPAVFAVLAFNMTMPLTLRATADVCRGHEGASFGLLTLALFIGYLPTVYGATLPFGTYGNVMIAVLSMAIMASGLELMSRRTKNA